MLDATASRCEVKGVWFVSLRDWLEAKFGRDVTQKIAARLSSANREAMTDPLPSAWYPEEALSAALRATDAELTHGDREAFLDLIDACTQVGLSRFFKVLLRVATPRFVLQQVPTMWRQIRRGTGCVSAVPVAGGIELRYTEFPYFSEPLYELLTLGSVRALMRTCTGSTPELRIVHRSRDALTLRVVL